MQLFADDVLPHFTEGREEREAKKAEELAPYIDAALARKNWMKALEDDEIPVIYSSVSQVKFAKDRTGRVKKL